MRDRKSFLNSSFLLKNSFFILFIHQLLFTAIPLISVGIAFKEFSFTKGIFSPFNGLENFRALLSTPGVGQVIGNTFLEGMFRVILLFGYALVLAQILHRIFRTRIGQALLFISLIPQFVSWVSTAAVMKLIFSNNGILFRILGTIPGFYSERLPFQLVLYLSILWHDGGFLALIILLALLSIDKSYYDAARLETKSGVVLFQYITWPFSRENLIIVLALLFFSFFSGIFEPLFNMGNPSLREATDTIDTLLYRIAFLDGDFGKAYALELVKNVINAIVVSSLVRRLLKYSFGSQMKISGKMNTGKPTRLVLFISAVIAVLYISILLVPAGYAIKGFSGVFKNTAYFRSIWRTLLIATMGGLFSAGMNTLIAYSLSLNKDRLIGTALTLIVLFGIVNGGYLGLSYAVKILGLKNNLIVLFLPYMFNFLYLIMTYSRIKSHAEEMIEAFRLDGAGEWRIFLERIFKMDLGHFLSLWLLYMIFIWNNWLAGILFINTPKKETIQSFIRTLLVDFSEITSVGRTATYVGLNERAAYIVLSIVPVLIMGAVIINLMKRRSKP